MHGFKRLFSVYYYILYTYYLILDRPGMTTLILTLKSRILVPGCALIFTMCISFRPVALIPFNIELVIVGMFFHTFLCHQFRCHWLRCTLASYLSSRIFHGCKFACSHYNLFLLLLLICVIALILSISVFMRGQGIF